MLVEAVEIIELLFEGKEASCTTPNREVVETFQANGGTGKPMIGQVTECWADDQAEARETALRWWPTAIVPGILHEQLPTPAYFEDVAERFATEENVAEELVCGPDKQGHLEAIHKMIETGYATGSVSCWL
jgi:hypothetical protein